MRDQFDIRVVVEFLVPVDIFVEGVGEITAEDAEECALMEVNKHLNGWDVPDYNILDVEVTQ